MTKKPMTLIATTLRAFLAGQPKVAYHAGARVTCSHRPQGAVRPAITIHLISGGHVHDLDGHAGNARARIQVGLWANTYPELEELADAVRTVLAGYHGPMGRCRSASAILDHEQDNPEKLVGATEVNEFHRIQDYLIRYELPRTPIAA